MRTWTMVAMVSLCSCAGLSDPSKAAKIDVCHTTYKEVIALYRQPNSSEVTITSDATLWNLRDQGGSISVRFNKKDVVVDYVVNPAQGQPLVDRCL